MKGRSVWQRWLWDPATRREPWSAWDGLAAEIKPHSHAIALGVSTHATYTLGDAVRRRDPLLFVRQFPRTSVPILLSLYVCGLFFLEIGWAQVAWFVTAMLAPSLLGPRDNARRRRLVLLRTARERSASIVTPLLSGDHDARLQAETEWTTRRARWREYIQAKIDNQSFRWSPLFRDAKVVNSLALMALFCGNFLVLVLVPPSPANPDWIAYFFPLGMIAWLGLNRGFRQIEKRRLRRLLIDMKGTHCPGCTYPLAPKAVSSARAGEPDINLGPSRCPECGCRWPLVPPIVSFETV